MLFVMYDGGVGDCIFLSLYLSVFERKVYSKEELKRLLLKDLFGC